MPAISQFTRPQLNTSFDLKTWKFLVATDMNNFSVEEVVQFLSERNFPEALIKSFEGS